MRIMSLSRRPHAPNNRSGTTMLELMVVVAILIVAVSIFSQIVTTTARVRATSHERALAAEAARGMLERLRNESIDDVFELFNASPSDDPAGPGTAPGHAFDVSGLDAQGADADGHVGEIFFPAVFVPDGQTDGMVQKGIENENGRADKEEVAPVMVTGKWALREDADLPQLGMPRDLNGDGMIDDVDHRYDVEILPVCIKVSWKGRYGDRSLQVYTLLTNFEPGVIR